jgi:hypothetical protein
LQFAGFFALSKPFRTEVRKKIAIFSTTNCRGALVNMTLRGTNATLGNYPAGKGLQVRIVSPGQPGTTQRAHSVPWP